MGICAGAAIPQDAPVSVTGVMALNAHLSHALHVQPVKGLASLAVVLASLQLHSAVAAQNAYGT